MKLKLINKIEQHNHVLFILLFTQAISMVGTRMTTIALGIWLYQKTGQTMDLLLIPLFNELPSLLFGHVTGVFVDRHDRKSIMLLADLGQALGTLMLFISIGSGRFEVIHLYLVVFLQGLFASMQEPAADATISIMTTPHNRTRVNGIKELSFPAAGIIAPVLAGVLYVAIGIDGVIVVDLVTFLLASLIMMSLKLPAPQKSGERSENRPVKDAEAGGSFLSERRVGIEFLMNSKGLFLLVLYMAIVNFALNGPLELVIPYILELTGSEFVLSSMLSLMSVATALTAVTMSTVSIRKNKIKIMFVSMMVTGFGLILFGVLRSKVMLGISLFMLMMPLPALNVVFKTILQEKTPQDLQGRVFSTSYQMAYGVAPLSFLLIGSLVDNVIEPFARSSSNIYFTSVFGSYAGSGMGSVFTLTGILIIATSIIFMSLKSFRHMEGQLNNYN